MRVLAESTYARYRQLFDPDYPFPEDGYQGDYICEIAEHVREKESDRLLSLSEEEALTCCKEHAEGQLFSSIKKVLARMGIVHDVFYNEDSLYTTGKINEVIEDFRKLGLVYEQDSALWLKATALGFGTGSRHRQIERRADVSPAGHCVSPRKISQGIRFDCRCFRCRSYRDDTGRPCRHQGARLRSQKSQSRYSSIRNAASGWGTGKDVETSCKFCDTR